MCEQQTVEPTVTERLAELRRAVVSDTKDASADAAARVASLMLNMSRLREWNEEKLLLLATRSFRS